MLDTDQKLVISYFNASHTIDLANERWRVLDQAHNKRNIAEYEGGIDMDEAIVQALIRVTDEIAERITA